jgi:hypothetical protein
MIFALQLGIILSLYMPLTRALADVLAAPWQWQDATPDHRWEDEPHLKSSAREQPYSEHAPVHVAPVHVALPSSKRASLRDLLLLANCTSSDKFQNGKSAWAGRDHCGHNDGGAGKEECGGADYCSQAVSRVTDNVDVDHVPVHNRVAGPLGSHAHAHAHAREVLVTRLASEGQTFRSCSGGDHLDGVHMQLDGEAHTHALDAAARDLCDDLVPDKTCTNEDKAITASGSNGEKVARSHSQCTTMHKSRERNDSESQTASPQRRSLREMLLEDMPQQSQSRAAACASKECVPGVNKLRTRGSESGHLSTYSFSAKKDLKSVSCADESLAKLEEADNVQVAGSNSAVTVDVLMDPHDCRTNDTNDTKLVLTSEELCSVDTAAQGHAGDDDTAALGHDDTAAQGHAGDGIIARNADEWM